MAGGSELNVYLRLLKQLLEDAERNLSRREVEALHDILARTLGR